MKAMQDMLIVWKEGRGRRGAMEEATLVCLKYKYHDMPHAHAYQIIPDQTHIISDPYRIVA